MVPNILAQRYASSSMNDLWSPEGKVKLERDFWIAVLKAQEQAGVAIAAGAIEAYERERDRVDLEDIRKREIETRHDVKARIESYNAQAGFEEIHKGMTSRDLTENVEQLQVYRSLDRIRLKSLSALGRIQNKAEEWRDVIITGRTHNVPAQATTMGKRLAMFGEEFLIAIEALDRLLESYPVRGLKGAVGTQLDPIRLLGGKVEKARELERSIREFLQIPRLLDAVGQVYPRSLDFQVVSLLVQLGSGPSNLAKTLRLMAGHELGSEGFAPGQVGSSAMPHKMNSRSCERINGLHTVLKGYLTMADGLTGDQWNEGDVSCSVVRRVMLPDSFFALDGLLETLITILDQMEIYPAVIEKENRKTMPFLITTAVLMEAVKRGVGRETAHGSIKKHALETVKELRSGQRQENNLLDRLAEDPDLRLKKADLEALLQEATTEVGAAGVQVDAFVSRAETWLERFPETRNYQPQAIL